MRTTQPWKKRRRTRGHQRLHARRQHPSFFSFKITFSTLLLYFYAFSNAHYHPTYPEHSRKQRQQRIIQKLRIQHNQPKGTRKQAHKQGNQLLFLTKNQDSNNHDQDSRNKPLNHFIHHLHSLNQWDEHYRTYHQTYYHSNHRKKNSLMTLTLSQQPVRRKHALTRLSARRSQVRRRNKIQKIMQIGRASWRERVEISVV